MYRSPGRCVPSRHDTAAPSAQLLTRRPGSDLDFWTLGHKLFGTTPETYPVAFLAGDILDGAFLAPVEAVLRFRAHVHVRFTDVTRPSPRPGARPQRQPHRTCPT